ncbi:CHAT domain-containing protein [Beggiatoa leptomitoformis]|uniref:CHAT domain-containing protein n=1 Tax=Beggiatoa leptomitoformis TaxID=288004 RepID=A0A2N9YEQ0_9GAMM|nr:CHAT domain-containing protein [Beggiatoa leptomitoformis]ALG68702.1 CHAT domain-containing protein [Beggiatoa leptomitoformis]AUI68944.1 CHAT domain-containing protein [Beggiatoa leptomitoformis]
MDERLIEAVNAFLQVSNGKELNQVLQIFPELITNKAEIRKIIKVHIEKYKPDKPELIWNRYEDMLKNTSRTTLYYIHNEGVKYLEKFWKEGQITDLDDAIEKLKFTVDRTKSDSPALIERLNSLGIAVQEYAARLSSKESYNKCFEIYQQLIAKIPNHCDSFALLSGLKNNLAISAKNFCSKGSKFFGEDRLKCFEKDMVKYSSEAIEHYAQAIELKESLPPNLELPLLHHTLGNCLTDHYERLKTPSDLIEGLKAYEESVEKTPRNSSNYPKFLNGLATAYINRYDASGESQDLDNGINKCREAIKLGEEYSLEERAGAARNLLNWGYKYENWNLIEEAYPVVQKNSNLLVEKQLLREHQEAFLKDTQGIAVRVAYARIRTKQLEGAVEALEQGVARLLSSALARSNADLAQLQQDSPELYARYQDSLQVVNNAQRFYQNAPENLREKAQSEWQTAEKQFNALLADIRQLQGHESFLLIATDINTVKQVSKQQALIYIFFTKKGGYALNVFQGQIQATALPELKEATLLEKINGYFNAYDERGETWFKAIETMTEWLCQAVMQPILQNTPPNSQTTLIPIGLLNLLPLHAAAYVTTDSKRRYVLDDYTISYAPNALSLQTARKRAQIPAQKLLAINEPRPVKANALPSCTVEIQAIQQYFAQADIFAHEKATQEAVKNVLNNGYSVLHFSCHGGAKPEDPLKTGLLMAHNEMLTVQDFLNAQLNARLVSLSACETGMIGVKQVEEVVSLPTSLLQAGVAGVVASLWSVADLSTMLLMAQFYHRWFNEYPDNPAKALRLAQIWVRNSTNTEKLAFIENNHLSDETIEKMEDAIGFSADTEQIFRHPYYWAAFSYTGI